MLYRLTEFECTACGHFMKGAKPVSGSGQSAVAAHIKRAAKDHPFAEPGPKSRLVSYDSSYKHVIRRNWLRLLFLVVAFAEFITIGLLVQHYNPDVDITGAYIRALVFGGLLLIGFAALTLYVDWRAFKIFVLVLLVAVMAAYAYEFAMVWTGKHQLPIIRLTADMIILGWFAILVYKDIIRKV